MDVVILRPFAILLLIILHSFTIYGGGWDPPKGFVEIDAYWWVAKLCSIFRLELIVFLAGYVFAYQKLVRGKTFTLSSVVRDKFKRLIIPCLIFSTLYFICFNLSEFEWVRTPYNIINGCGHTWFLPMLFWCFVGGYLLTKIQISTKFKILFLLLLTVLQAFNLPLRLNSAAYYLFYFYFGYVVIENKEYLETLINGKTVIKVSLLFIVTYILVFRANIFLDKLEGYNFYIKYFSSLFSLYSKILYASLGIFSAIIIVNYILLKHPSVPNWILESNKICYPVYIFHQFILKYLYYHTNIPDTIGPYLLPFFGLIISLSLSIILSVGFNKTKVGKMIF